MVFCWSSLTIFPKDLWKLLGYRKFLPGCNAEKLEEEQEEVRSSGNKEDEQGYDVEGGEEKGKTDGKRENKSRNV